MKKVFKQTPPSMTWTGIIGLSPSTDDGVKRSGVIFENIVTENIIK